MEIGISINNQFFKTILLLLFLSVFMGSGYAQQSDKAPITVHAVTDLSHEFSFYGDHRFHTQYLKNEKGVTNWCSLFNFDFSNANLLILLGCANEINYLPKDITTINDFLKAGGAVLIMGTHTTVSQNKLIKTFGAEFKDVGKLPLIPCSGLPVKEVQGDPGSILVLDQPNAWEVLVKDARNKPEMVRRKVGQGTLIVASRSLAGSHPDASDPINASFWIPLLKKAAEGKKIDSAKPFADKGIKFLEYVEKLNDVSLRYNDYLKPYAKPMFNISDRCTPFIEKRMGVPKSKGMASTIALLATGDGGFSSGETIALGVWWGGFPKKEDSMIEFITHENTHSWVLPFPEVWNEPIATYVGDLVMMDMGYPEEGKKRIKIRIDRARKYDPEMKLYDLDGKSLTGAPDLTGGAQNDVHWGKTFWILEDMRKQDPDFVAKYFQAKRKYALQGKVTKYDMNNTVAVMSIASGRDLFNWFREHGFNVDRDKAEIKFVLN